MLAMNVVNPSKKGNLVGTSFHLIYTDNITAYLFDSTFNEPIVWGSKTAVRSITTQLGRDDLLGDKNASVVVSVYLPTNKNGGLKMTWQWAGLVSKMILPAY